jgi:hypothetical protein
MTLTTHWSRYVRHWHLLRPPLRPNAEVVERVRSLIAAEAQCLLLGSTMEFAALGPGIVSMDASFQRLAELWRSAAPGGLAIQGDWSRMPVRGRAFSHVLGDGSLNAVAWSGLPAVLGEVTRVLRPGGTLIARAFCRPPAAERPDEIARDVEQCRVDSFHELKWRIAMAMPGARQTSDVPVRDLRDAVIAAFPDRDALCRLTGWSRAEVDTVDVYEGSSDVYSFPTEEMFVAALRRWFADVEIVRCGGYPLAERCPLVVARGPIQEE